MRHRLRVGTLILVGVFSGVVTADCGAADAEKTLQAVLWTGGFAHDFKAVSDCLTSSLGQYIDADITIARDAGFLDQSQARPDLVVMYHCHTSANGVLNAAQKECLLNWVREGMGVVALHASYYSFANWDDVHFFYGPRFVKHGDSKARLVVSIVDPTHPVTKGGDPEIELISELYESTSLPPDCHVLATSQEKGSQQKQPSVWTRQYGKGRIVTILPGHWPENFKVAAFQKLIARSMRYACTPDTNTTNRQPDVSASFKLPDGFGIELVAAEPYLANPISMTLDEQGRVYVSNAHSYRKEWWNYDKKPLNMKPSNPIVCLTVNDSDRMIDGRVVAAGFENPVMGMAVCDGRMWYSNLNRILTTRLGDDGRFAGEPKELVRDSAEPWNPFGMYRLGFGRDGLLYNSIGDHPTKLSNAEGEVHVRTSGGGSGAVFRFRDDGSQLEMLLQGMRAPFTSEITPFGQHWVISNGEGSPNIVLDAVRGADYRFRHGRRAEWAWLTSERPLAAPTHETRPGSSTSVLPYYSSAFPEEYWGDLFVANFGTHGQPVTNNEILRYRLDEHGQIAEIKPFLTSTDTNFRPTDVRIAPDGNLYVLDWHGRDDENDLTGRLYKITYHGKPTVGVEKQSLASRNQWQRQKAGAALLAAGEKSLPALTSILEKKDPLAAAEALWILRRSNWPERAQVMILGTRHSDRRVRRLAVQLLAEIDAAPQEVLERMVNDSDPAVKLEAALAMGDVTKRVLAVVTALRGGAAEIRRLRYAGALEVARYGDAATMESLLRDNDADVRLAGMIALEEAFYESSEGFTRLAAGDVQEIRELRQQIAALKTAMRDGSEETALRNRDQGAIATLEKRLVALSNVVPADEARRALATMMINPGRVPLSDLLTLLTRWPQESLRKDIQAIALQQLRTASSPREFADGIIALKRVDLDKASGIGSICRGYVQKLMANSEFANVDDRLAVLKIIEAAGLDSESRRLLIRAISDSDSRVRSEAASICVSTPSADLVAACWDVALDATLPTARKLDAIAVLPRIEAALDKRWHELLVSADPVIATAAVRSLSLGPDRESAVSLIKRAVPRIRNIHGNALDHDIEFALNGPVGNSDNNMLRKRLLAAKSGNVDLGRLVFQNRSCTACHDSQRSAAVLAPSLDGIGKIHNADYLIDSVLYPSKVVKTGFMVQTIHLSDGKIVQGRIHRDVGGEGRWDELTHADGRRELLPHDSVTKVESVSLMPAGLEMLMSESELRDLITYLQSR